MPLLLATAPPGLEPVVLRELEERGLSGEAEPGAVRFEAAAEEAVRLARALRTPARLLLPLAEGPARGLDDLARLVRAADWSPWLWRDSPVRVAVSARLGRLRVRRAVERKVAHALADVRRALPPLRRPQPEQRVAVRVDGERARIAIDLGGAEALHRRGWRLATGKAPLRENVAACLLVMAGWQGDEALLDPFCGAGTLPIEAALLALGRPPHAPERRLACESSPLAARAGIRPPRAPRPAAPPVPVVGSDRDPRVLLAARDNAERAGVRLAWSVLDVDRVRPPAPTGLLVANPPRGDRLGRDVAGVYAALGRLLRGPLAGWRALFLAPRRELAERVDRRAERLTTFVSGGVRVGAWVLDPRR